MTIQENEDVRYFRERYEKELADSGPEAAEKYRLRLEMLKDSLVVYHETRLGNV
jgi:hypothetical protein